MTAQNELLTICPKCSGELAIGGVRHCDIQVRPKPCGWIKHRPCGAVVNPRTGRYYGGPSS